MEINKLIGYTEINTSDGVLPLKIGTYVLEKFCESYGIDLEGIDSVFVSKEYEINGVKSFYQVPKETIKFLALILHHGVNYVAGIKGTTQYPLLQAYEWIDQIGISSPDAINIMGAFIASIRNGGSPVEIEKDSKKVKKKALNVANAA